MNSMLSMQVITVLWPRRLQLLNQNVNIYYCTSGSWFLCTTSVMVVNDDENYILVKILFLVEYMSSSLNYLLLFQWIKVMYCFSSVVLPTWLPWKSDKWIRKIILSPSNVIRCIKLYFEKIHGWSKHSAKANVK